MKKLLFITLVNLLTCNFLFSQVEEAYLVKSQLKLSELTGDVELPILDSVVNRYDVFNLGIVHSLDNKGVELFFLRHLIERHAVNIFVMEVPHSYEILVNAYFKSGDEYYLRCITSSLDGNLNRNVELFKYLYEKNKTNPITVKGIDIEHDYWTTLFGFDYLMRNKKDIPGEIERPIVDVLRSGDHSFPFGTTMKKKRKRLLALCKDFEIRDSIYKTFLGNEYEDFKKILEGVIAKEKSNTKLGSRYRDSIRENYLYNSYLNVLNANSNEKVFGFFGRAHVNNESSIGWVNRKNWTTMTAMLNNRSDSPVKDKVCSLIIYYPYDSIESKTPLKNKVIPPDKVKAFLENSNSETTLFKLDNPNSPFKEMAEKFQFLIVARFVQNKK